MSAVLMQVSDASEKATAIATMRRNIRRTLPNQGLRNIGFRGGNSDQEMFSEGHGKLWCAFLEVDHPTEPRQWNSFGVFDADRKTQHIAVEINIPLKSNTRRFAGFFAKDMQTHRTFLLHDGSIGGGTQGVSRANFLNWLGAKRTEVTVAGQSPREGVVIGDIAGRDFASRLASYVMQVNAFKEGVKQGAIAWQEIEQAAENWGDYVEEASGRRQGQRQSELDYLSYHGDVVRCLKNARAKKLKIGERIGNTQMVDLFVERAGKISEVYEVKTCLSRQTLYTALGQVITHSLRDGQKAKRILVLPEGKLPLDFHVSFDALNVEVRRYKVSGREDRKVTLL